MTGKTVRRKKLVREAEAKARLNLTMTFGGGDAPPRLIAKYGEGLGGLVGLNRYEKSHNSLLKFGKHLLYGRHPVVARLTTYVK